MNNPALDLITEYNTKAFDSLNTLSELSMATVESFVKKQAELSNSLFESSVASSKEIASVKTPDQAVEISNKLVKTFADSVNGFVTETTTNTLQARESLKSVIDDTYALNGEFAVKAYNSSVEAFEKSGLKVA